MPFSYVPSTRVLRVAWSSVAVLVVLVVAGLAWASIVMAHDLQRTNSRLNQSEVQKQALMRRLHSRGFALTFVKGDHRSSTYTCKLTAGDAGYTCRAQHRRRTH